MKKLFISGFAASIAMTALMYVAPMMGMPKMDIATMLGTMFLASPGPAFWLGMIIHLMMGTVLFPAVYRIALQPGTGGGTGKGVLFGLLLWAAANFMVMPMMGVIHPMVKSGTRHSDVTSRSDGAGWEPAGTSALRGTARQAGWTQGTMVATSGGVEARDTTLLPPDSTRRG